MTISDHEKKMQANIDRMKMTCGDQDKTAWHEIMNSKNGLIIDIFNFPQNPEKAKRAIKRVLVRLKKCVEGWKIWEGCLSLLEKDWGKILTNGIKRGTQMLGNIIPSVTGAVMGASEGVGLALPLIIAAGKAGVHYGPITGALAGGAVAVIAAIVGALVYLWQDWSQSVHQGLKDGHQLLKSLISQGESLCKALFDAIERFGSLVQGVCDAIEGKDQKKLDSVVNIWKHFSGPNDPPSYAKSKALPMMPRKHAIMVKG